MKQFTNSYDFNRKKPANNREIVLQGLYVEKHEGEDVESMLHRLKKKVKKSKLLVDLNKYAFYTKPSEVKKRKRHIAKLRTMDEQGLLVEKKENIKKGKKKQQKKDVM